MVVVGGREDRWEWKEESLVISVTVDMVVAFGGGVSGVEGVLRG